jgi:hypothetical protein
MKKLVFIVLTFFMFSLGHVLADDVSQIDVGQPTDDIPMLESTYNVSGQNLDEDTKTRKLIKDGVIPPKENQTWQIVRTVDPGSGHIVSVPIPVRPARPTAP